MKLLTQILSLLIIILLISCAKQSTPMGGDKDETPPKLVSVKPINESTNVSPQTIELEFDEFIKIDNPNKQIIITPKIKKDEMVVTAIKNKVVIKLNQDLEENTTYVFNFQKSIQDITESNPAENLKLVFSTGDKIDSLKFSGKVSYVFPPKDKFMKDVLVGLYEKNDTTDVLTAPPYYIAATDSSGNFEITNIKAGDYRAYAWFDSNNSLKAEEKSEPYAFYGDTITIDKDVENINFMLSKADISDLKINRSSTIGENFDIVLSKFPTDITIEHEDLGKKLFYRQNEKNIRFYHTEIRNDSIKTRVSLKDSVGFKLDTLIYLTFEESERNKEKLETTTNSGSNFLKNIKAEYTFNKPITDINLDSLYIKFDTASTIQIKKEWIYLKDSANYTKLLMDIPILDTLPNTTYTIYAADSTFKDVEGLYNEKKVEASYKKLNPETLVTSLDVVVDTEFRPLLIQLLDKSGKVIKEVLKEDTNKHSFTDFEAGTYNLRVIFDENKNKRWDPSNMRQNRQAEKVFYYKNPTDITSMDIIIKGGWTNDIVVLTSNSTEKTSEENIEQDKTEEIIPDTEENELLRR
ncbi:Ig-like domain-containing domain [Belliella sp. R4-6]|uniref:Ig-like domain-containing domain n=1 Tax=Belliella alkalica TaxID=1730871 RepID=A0ABS9VDU3_9BACT|nr:Ig-like domain-containing domain [Belliella alkalica]MCH7414582.1 Ig-like domain-containing domain [Belliella alkalica]